MLIISIMAFHSENWTVPQQSRCSCDKKQKTIFFFVVVDLDIIVHFSSTNERSLRTSRYTVRNHKCFIVSFFLVACACVSIYRHRRTDEKRDYKRRETRSCVVVVFVTLFWSRVAGIQNCHIELLPNDW